jgi:hypothetical protein
VNSEPCHFDRGGHCVALSRKNCDGCNFFKTTEQADADRQRAEERLVRIGRVGGDEEEFVGPHGDKWKRKRKGVN